MKNILVSLQTIILLGFLSINSIFSGLSLFYCPMEDMVRIQCCCTPEVKSNALGTEIAKADCCAVCSMEETEITASHFFVNDRNPVPHADFTSLSLSNNNPESFTSPFQKNNSSTELPQKVPTFIQDCAFLI